MAKIPGATNVVPGVFSETRTLQRGVSVPIGSRLAVILGEGLKEEVLVSKAVGNGDDGFNSSYTSTSGATGRHFLLGRGQTVVAPVIINRSRLFKNGVELVLLEEVIDSNSFDGRFGARIDPTTGQVELQAASLVDQGGEFFRSATSNSGNGVVSNLSLIDPNAVPETWTVRCSSVRRDGYGVPVDGYARFIARGSQSGVLLDGYGNQIVWQSDGVIKNNGVLNFSIDEGLTPFQEGDYFVIQTQNGALTAGDSLTARYISQLDLNDPEFFTDLNELIAKHGQPSVLNRLSLGAQLAFANGTPGVFALQTKPAVPRRISYTLNSSANGQADIEDLTWELPLNVVPDVDSNINFFITNPTTRNETQIIPNKVDFFNPTYTTNPSAFVFGTDEYSYTVVLDDSVQKSAKDGVLTVTTPSTAILSSATVSFGLEDLAVTRTVRIQNSTLGNDGVCTITEISEGELSLSGTFSTDETDVEFLVLDSIATSARVLFTSDLALNLGESLRCTVVDVKDADFFDAGWLEAYESAETIDIDIVVPLPSQTISAIFQNGKVHVETMSNILHKRERVLFAGAIKGLTPNNVIGTIPGAVEDIGILEGIQGDDVSEILAGNTEDLADYGVQDGFGDSYRVVYFYPDEIIVQAGANRVMVDGFFVGAAAAGYFSGSTQIQEPLTNKRLTGFTIGRNKVYPPVVERNIVNSGITLVTPVAGGGRVIWGKTTTISLEPTEEEISIVFIRDRISKAMRRAYLPYVGRAETPTLKATLFAVAQSLMQSFIQQKLITAYGGLTVRRDPVEPRQWNITVSVQPVYPTNWIYILINVGMLE
ncbi:MAG: hypothetical protein WC942_01345 [Clostridia bacterium]|jgi:hypothetical protein